MPNRKQSPTDFNFTVPKIPNPEVAVLSNGLKVHNFHNATVDILKFEFIFKHANTLQESLNGLNLLTSKALFSGTQTYSGKQIADQIAQLGAFIDISPSFDYTILNIYCLSSDVNQVLNLVYHVLIKADFPDKEIVLQKNIALANLKTQQQKNNIVASKRLRSLIFQGHAYGRSLTEDDIKKLNRASIITHFEQYYSELEVIVSGNITSKVTESLNQLEPNKLRHHPFIENEELPKDEPKIDTLRVKNSLQTSIRIGKRIIEKSHRDYPKLVLANYILGGFFGSRLMNNLREEKGLTYGIHSSITALKYGNYFSIGCDVKSQDTNLALDQIKKEIESLKRDLILAEEFNTSKNHYIGSFQNSLSSIYSLSDKYKNRYLYNLKESFYLDTIESIQKLKPQDIKSVVAEYLDYSQMSIVTVGG